MNVDCQLKILLPLKVSMKRDELVGGARQMKEWGDVEFVFKAMISLNRLRLPSRLCKWLETQNTDG